MQDSIFKPPLHNAKKPNGLREAEYFEKRRCPTNNWSPPGCDPPVQIITFIFIAFKNLLKTFGLTFLKSRPVKLWIWTLRTECQEDKGTWRKKVSGHSSERDKAASLSGVVWTEWVAPAHSREHTSADRAEVTDWTGIKGVHSLTN